MGFKSSICWGVVSLMLAMIITTSALLAQADHHDPKDPAHWYPLECCSLRDCDVVTKIEYVPEGRLVTSKYGTVLVPVNYDKTRASKDENFHVCMRDDIDEYSTNSGDKQLLCFFAPAGAALPPDPNRKLT